MRSLAEVAAAVVIVAPVVATFAVFAALDWAHRQRTERPECVNLGVVHVNGAPLLYQDCDGETVRVWLHVPQEDDHE